ncbi:MAG: hypothetical protein ABEJ80_03815 [Halarchaeum sp.]
MGEVLDATLDVGRPVYLMGNTVAAFMRALSDELDERALEWRP